MSTKIEKDQVLTKYRGISGKIKKLKSTPEFTYKTMHKFIPGAGAVTDLKSEKDVAIAHSVVNREIAMIKVSANELGIELNSKDYQYMGFSLKVWNEEIVNRLTEIRNTNEINKLTKAKEILKGHLSEADLFDLDMMNLGADLSDVDDYSDFDSDDVFEEED